MRYIMCLMMLLGCALGALAYNEVIPAVAYNPSRAGAYQKLIAVQNATFRKGIETEGDKVFVNVMSKEGSSVILVDEQKTNDGKLKHACMDKNCTINKINTITSGDGVQVNAKVIQRYPVDANPFFPADEKNGYKINDTKQPEAGNGTTVFVHEVSSFRAGDSYINSFTENKDSTVANLTAKAETLTVNGNLHAQTSFTLGNIKVSAPAVGGCTSNCKGYDWVTRVDKNDGKTHNVLAVEQ